MLVLPVFLLTLLAGCSASSSDFQKGVDAYNKRDYATALREWRPLAEQGHADAQTRLGWMYAEGEGGPEDDKEAMKWYRLAAEQGYAPAQFSLGYMYARGEGVPKDYVEAHKWVILAAANGNEAGVFLRDEFEKLMTPSQIEKAQNLSKEWVKKH